MEKKSISERNCKLQTETEGLRWFTTYTEKNCLFECKTRIAKTLCRCFPVWMMEFMDPQERLETSVCNIEVGTFRFLVYVLCFSQLFTQFVCLKHIEVLINSVKGNKCYDKELQNLEWGLEEQGNLGSPPCGCYADCNSIK